jgi:hypothetical protein
VLVLARLRYCSAAFCLHHHLGWLQVLLAGRHADSAASVVQVLGAQVQCCFLGQALSSFHAAQWACGVYILLQVPLQARVNFHTERGMLSRLKGGMEGRAGSANTKGWAGFFWVCSCLHGVQAASA